MAAQDHSKKPPVFEPIAFSNAVRLTLPQWFGVGVFAVFLVVFAPSIWSRMESFTLESDYRMPFEQGNDYWLFERYAGLAAENDDTLILGDSVVWGLYATREQTLSHYLNQEAGKKQRCANLGLNAAHPLALEGLVADYGRAVAGKRVILHCNPLWMSSAKADLQSDREDDEVKNHPRLIAQFSPKIPGYREEISTRLGVIVERHFAFNQWTNHLQQAYYERKSLPAWTLEHPYDNPFKPLTRGLPPSVNKPREEPIPWTERGIKVEDTWVEMETSLQWAAFRRVVELLQQRDNRVFVLVGPFNEHCLTPASRKKYQQVKATIATWLNDKQVPHAVPNVLPSEMYGDSSHPLAAGYELLARKLHEDPAFP
jgi:hypothetical protein